MIDPKTGMLKCIHLGNDDIARACGLDRIEDLVLEPSLHILECYLGHFVGTDDPLWDLRIGVSTLQAMQEEGGYCVHLEEDIERTVNIFRQFNVWDLL